MKHLAALICMLRALEKGHWSEKFSASEILNNIQRSRSAVPSSSHLHLSRAALFIRVAVGTPLRLRPSLQIWTKATSASSKDRNGLAASAEKFYDCP